MDISKYSVKKNAIMNIILTLSNMFLPLISYTYVTRILSIEGMGQVNFYNSMGEFCILVAWLGIGVYGIRISSQVRDDKNKLSLIVKELIIIHFISSLIVLIIIFFSALFIDKLKENIVLFTIQIIMIVANVVNLDWMFAGMEDYAYITKRSLLIRLISIILIFLFVKEKDDYILYAIIVAVNVLINILLNIFYARRYLNYNCKERANIIKHIRPILLLAASILAINIYCTLDSVMLGFICGNEAVAYYSMSVKIKNLTLSFVNSISIVLLPRLSYYISHAEEEQYNKLLKKSIVIICVIAIPMSSYFMLDAEETVMILGGPDYVAAAQPLCILMPILIVSGFSNITGNQILIPNNMDMCFLKAVCAGALVDIVMNFFLLVKYSYIGAAVATLSAECIQMCIQIYYSRDYLKKNININELYKIMICNIMAVLMLFVLKKSFIFETFIVNYFVHGFSFFMIYVFLVNIFNINYIKDIEYKAYKKILDATSTRNI